MKNLNHKLVAILTTGVMMSSSFEAFAQAASSSKAETLSSVTTNLKTSSKGIPEIISMVAYIGGIGLGVSGIIKIKDHVDNPGSNPLKAGLARLGGGGALLALPYITKAMMGSVGGEAGAGGVSLKSVGFTNTKW